MSINRTGFRGKPTTNLGSSQHAQLTMVNSSSEVGDRGHQFLDWKRMKSKDSVGLSSLFLRVQDGIDKIDYNLNNAKLSNMSQEVPMILQKVGAMLGMLHDALLPVKEVLIRLESHHYFQEHGTFYTSLFLSESDRVFLKDLYNNGRFIETVLKEIQHSINQHLNGVLIKILSASQKAVKSPEQREQSLGKIVREIEHFQVLYQEDYDCFTSIFSRLELYFEAAEALIQVDTKGKKRLFPKNVEKATTSLKERNVSINDVDSQAQLCTQMTQKGMEVIQILTSQKPCQHTDSKSKELESFLAEFYREMVHLRSTILDFERKEKAEHEHLESAQQLKYSKLVLSTMDRLSPEIKGKISQLDSSTLPFPNH